MNMTFDLKTVLGIIGWVASIVTLYFGLSNKIDLQGTQLGVTSSTMQTISDRVSKAEEASRAQERALIELTVTLRAKEVIK